MTRHCPHSIYEVPGAREVAIEFRSFSKKAGFTGTRCAFTVVPKDCMAYDSQGSAHSLHTLWHRRHTTKFNGVSYPVQRAAEAVYSEAGHAQVTALADGYLKNAALIRTEMEALGFACAGGGQFALHMGGWPKGFVAVFSTCCLKKPASSQRRGPGSAGAVKGLSASVPSTATKNVKRAMALIKDALMR